MATLKFGDKNNEVQKLQELLSTLGYPLTPDGDYGNNTLKAINNFKELNNLPIGEEVDDNLLQLIIADTKYNANIDKVSIDRIMKLHPLVRFEILHLMKQCYKSNVKIRVVQGLRTIAEQDALYAQGRTKPGPIVTNAKGGYSNHNYGLSIDFCLLNANGSISWSQIQDADKDGKADWMEVVEVFKQRGYEWGGNWKFKDTPHLEKTFNMSVKQLMKLQTSGKIDKDGYVLI